MPLWPDGASAARRGSDTVPDTGSDARLDPTNTRPPVTLLWSRPLALLEADLPLWCVTETRLFHTAHGDAASNSGEGDASGGHHTSATAGDGSGEGRCLETGCV